MIDWCEQCLAHPRMPGRSVCEQCANPSRFEAQRPTRFPGREAWLGIVEMLEADA